MQLSTWYMESGASQKGICSITDVLHACSTSGSSVPVLENTIIKQIPCKFLKLVFLVLIVTHYNMFKSVDLWADMLFKDEGWCAHPSLRNVSLVNENGPIS